ncbi:MAG: hypothetical protein NVS9B13_08800 [Candidatus Acidiferrum sp.]
MLRAKKIILAPRMAGVLVAILALCASQASAQAHAADASPFREFVDDTGRAVRVPQVVRRVVSLAPSLTETIYALGMQDRLVGDTDYCDYPAEAQKKAKVGGAINPSIETIASLHPDLVLVTKSLNRLETVRALEGLGIPSYATDPRTVDEIISSTRKIAEVLGTPEAGKSVAEDMEKHLGTLKELLSGVPLRRVLFVVWTEPLISIGRDTFIADALRRAGAISIVDSAQSWPQTNLEEAVHLQPEYLVFASSHSENVTHDFDVLASRPGWRILDAVQKRRFAVISDAVNRPSPRIVSAIEELARQLHPEVFLEKQNKEKIENGESAAPGVKSTDSTVLPKFRPAEKELACAL